jgi:hypothetical protein
MPSSNVRRRLLGAIVALGVGVGAAALATPTGGLVAGPPDETAATGLSQAETPSVAHEVEALMTPREVAPEAAAPELYGPFVRR